MSLILSLLIGAGFGAALGYFGKCSSGSCPLTANWWRGATYGAAMGLMIYYVSVANGSKSVGELSANIKLISEEQFDAEVNQPTMPVVVDFFATWCGPCKALSPLLDDLAGPLTNKVKFLKVDIDQASRLAERFGIEAVPTLVILRNGKVVDKLVGLPSKGALQKRLESLASLDSLTAKPK